VLSMGVASGHLRDSTRVLFVIALPADEDFAVRENLQFPARALPRMVPEFAGVNITVRQSDAPDFRAESRLVAVCAAALTMSALNCALGAFCLTAGMTDIRHFSVVIRLRTRY
jgi:hypothetical protein